MDKVKVLCSLEEVKALSEPYRFKILNCFYEINKPATVKQIADKLGEVPANIHYHVKKLEKFNIIELDHTEEIRGIIAKYYKPTAERFEIKCTEDIDRTAKTLMLGETQRMLSKLYDDSKETFLNQLIENSSLKQGDKRTGTITVEDVFLTEEEAIEFTKYINDFLNRHKALEAASKKIKYQCFFSIIRSN